MPIVPSDKKGERPLDPVVAHRLAQAAEERERLLDAASGAVREVASATLPRAVLLQHLLASVLSDEVFTIRLGAVRVTPVGCSATVTLDPRGPDGIDAAHVWLEDGAGRVHDVAILGELAAGGLVDRDTRIEGRSRAFERGGLRFDYEEIPELELLHVADAVDWVRRSLLVAAIGELPPGEEPRPCPLAVGWRAAR